MIKPAPVSAGTRKQYLNAVRQIRRRAAFERHRDPQQIVVDEIVDYLVANHNKRQYEAATWRLYRAAMRHVYGMSIGAEDAIRRLEDLSGGGRKKKATPYGASSKMKSFPPRFFDPLIVDLDKPSRSELPKALKIWLVATLETGLRPSEWLHAEIVMFDGERHLRVKNAKFSHERANGEYRHINIEHVDDYAFRAINGMLIMMRAIHRGVMDMQLPEKEAQAVLDKHYRNYFDQCRRLLRQRLRKLLPSRKSYPSIYSARHQFIANCKADGKSLKEIAALCGHASTQTSALHYGKKRSGFEGRVMVTPRPEEVLTVRTDGKEFYTPTPKDTPRTERESD